MTKSVENSLEEDNPLLTEIEDMVENALVGKGKGYLIMIVDRKSNLTSIACNMKKKVVIEKLYTIADNLSREDDDSSN